MSLIKIQDDKLETVPYLNQYIVFKCGDLYFAGVYMGKGAASPLTMDGSQAPLILIEEWLPIRLWG